MQFDPSFAEKHPYLSGILPKSHCNKSEIATTIHVQPNPTHSPPLSQSTVFLDQNNSQRFQQHHLNRSNHRSGFLREGLSSGRPFSMIPTPSLGNSYKVAHTNESVKEFSSVSYPVAFTPTNNKTEALPGNLNSNKSFTDFSPKNLQQNGAISQSWVGHSVSQIPVYDAHASIPVNLNFQEELSYLVGVGNNSQDTDPRIVGNEEKLKRVHRKNIEIQHNDTAKITGQWTADEDRALVQLVDRYGKNWGQITKSMNGRTGKQCRERWKNHLQIDIKKDSWNELEDKILIEAHKVVGNKWTEIAKRLPGRTENSVKNHWYTTKRRHDLLKKQNGNKGTSDKTLLLNYIKEVTDVEEVEKGPKQSMSMMNIGSKKDHNNILGQVHVRYEISDGSFSSENWNTKDNEFGDYAPMMFTDDVMRSQSDMMDYGDRMHTLLEDATKNEMDFMDMLYKKP